MSQDVTYVVAVSGGVDSIVLLDALFHNRLSDLAPNYQLPTTNYKLIIAHFDHGIRKDSSSDEAFVRGVAGEYGLIYETERAELGTDASEETARTMRYKFLRQCCNKHNAVLITAHHQDDVLETMLINLIRGTGWRGLAPMAQIPDFQTPTTNHQPLIIRPLLDTPKSELLSYATKHNLKWQEDSTNSDTKYLRNHVRLNLIPAMIKKDPTSLHKLLKINQNVKMLKKEIATELQKITTNHQLPPTNYTIPRYALIMWPPLVAHEVIYAYLTQLDPAWHPDSAQINRALHFIKTAQNHKEMEVSRHLRINIDGSVVQFKKV